MNTRWPIVVGITAICGGLAWLVIRTPGTDPMSPQGSGDASAPARPGKAALGAPLPPVLDGGSETPRPALPEGSAAPDPGFRSGATFAAEDRDATWAPKTELEIKRRMAAIHGARLESTECRQSQCVIVIAGTQDELGKTLSAIEEPGGLHGFAENILLTAPERKDDKLVLRAYASFAR